jgi:hypothetical protein
MQITSMHSDNTCSWRLLCKEYERDSVHHKPQRPGILLLAIDFDFKVTFGTDEANQDSIAPL